MIILFRDKLGGPGVYAWRTRKPAALLGLPFFGRHFGYVGETTSVQHRMRQHLGTPAPGDEYAHAAQPWSDLSPKLVLFIGLPKWKWLLRAVETFVMLLTWPVYNDRKNRWNPRRIPRDTAQRMRAKRNRRARRWTMNVRPFHVIGWLAFLLFVAYSVLR